MDLRAWIVGDLESLRNRLANGVYSIIPPGRTTEQVDGGGVAAVYATWHMARHHDLAVNGVIRQQPEVLDEWGERVGLTTDTWRGLAENEDQDLVNLLDPAAVNDYMLAVTDSTKAWVANADLAILDTTPDSSAALDRIGAPPDRFDWLYGMWEGKPASFYLSWEAIGHGYSHLGELTATRNRMGLSPF